MKVLTLPGVFTPHSDSWLLLDAVDRLGPIGGRDALDVCTGSGVVAIGLAQRGARTFAVDISRRAALSARANALRCGARVRVLRGDLFDPVGDTRFDLITSNPPYVPGPAGPASGAARAWEAGDDGRRSIRAIVAAARARLRPGGILLLVHSSLVGERQTLDDLVAHGFDPGVVLRRTGPLGPLMRAQQAAGRIDGGIDHEDLVVFAGIRR